MSAALSKLSWINPEGLKLEIYGTADAVQDARDVIIFACGNTNVKMELQNGKNSNHREQGQKRGQQSGR